MNEFVVFKTNDYLVHPAQANLNFIKDALNQWQANELIRTLKKTSPLALPSAYQMLSKSDFDKVNKNKQIKLI